MSYITIDQINFTYPNGHQAIDNLSLNIEQGEIVAIVGQNGAGKTTTVKMLNGLLKPTSGKVTIDGTLTADTTTAKLAAKVGYVFQNPDDQIFHDNVYDEIAFGPRHQKLSDSQVKKQVKQAIELTGLSEEINSHPYELPYSKRKFVTIAAILAMDVDVVILDEPTAGQDSSSIELLGELVSSLKQAGKTVIIITHDMDFVNNNFDRTIVMTNKQKVFDGATAELFTEQDILEKACLELPSLLSLKNKLKITSDVTNARELAEAIINKG